MPDLPLRPLLVALLLTLLAALPRAGVVRTVGEAVDWLDGQDAHVDGPHHPTLAAALAAAAPGDTLLLLPGVHRGRHRLDKRLTLTGVAAGRQPVVQGDLEILADGVVLERLVFERVGSPAVLVREAADVVVRDCRFLRLPAGVELVGGDRVLIQGNRFERVTRPLRLRGGDGHRLLDNRLDGAGVVAIDAEGTSDLLVQDNTLTDLGWAGLALHSRGGPARVLANRFEGGDMGLVLQSDGHLVQGNHFAGMARGVLVGSSPLGKDGAVHDHVALLDAAGGDHQVATTGVRLVGNSFEACRREALLLRGAPGNELSGNHVGGGPGHGVVLLSGSDGNVLTDNRFATRDGEHVLVAASAGTRMAGNRSLGPDGGPLAAVLVDSPAAGHQGDRPPVLRDPTDRPGPRRSPDGSGRLLVFGDFHTHSVLSDGSCAPEDILRYGRDVLGLDFVALSDHGEILSQQPERWPAINRVVQEFALPGSFATLAGYEVTYPVTWAGHWNVYFPHDRGSLHRAPYDDFTGLCDTSTFSPRRLIDALVDEGEEFVIIRHHFGPTEDYWLEAPVEPHHVPATELCSVHGVFSGERDSNRNRNHPMGHDQDHLGSVAGGLAAGRVMGLVGSSDTHYGFPGDDGLAVVVLEQLAPHGITDALRERTTYATTGAPIALAFSVDGTPMGGLIAPAAAHELRLVVEGTAPLEELTLYRGSEAWRVLRPTTDADGTTVWRDRDGRELGGEPLPLDGRPADARALALTLRDERPSGPGTFWRLRVRQRDGELAWSTPVWTHPTGPDQADDEVLLDKERLSLMVYAASLRAWPKLPLGALGGVSPSQAMATPAGREQVLALWPELVANAERINAQARELGLTSRAVAERALERFHHRWGNDLPRTVLATEPVIDVDLLAEQLGIER